MWVKALVHEHNNSMHALHMVLQRNVSLWQIKHFSSSFAFEATETKSRILQKRHPDILRIIFWMVFPYKAEI